jgi:hypothetical protein
LTLPPFDRIQQISRAPSQLFSLGASQETTDLIEAGRVDKHQGSDQFPVASTMELRSVEVPYDALDPTH